MNKKNSILLFSLYLLLTTFYFVPLDSVYAAYVLPYPSYMPGHKLYRVARLIDEVKRYWHWGNLSSHRYYLGQSDKALVEAKTLFEYQQYLLAVQALERSNDAIGRAIDPLQRAKAEGKDIEKYKRKFGEAMDEHKRLITKLIQETPEKFLWTPEKTVPQALDLRQALSEAERIRSELIAKLP